MEYCSVGSITDLINITKRVLTERQIASILQAILQGLAHLHRKKIIHRDVKAANILLNDAGQAKLADFGVSAQSLHTNARHFTHIGSPYWMSPEILNCTQYDHKTDIWSLGVTAIELTEGIVPYSHLKPFMAVWTIKNKPIYRLKHPDNYSPELAAFIQKCVQVDQTKRPEAQQLLSHSFIKKYAFGSQCLSTLVASTLHEIEQFRLGLSRESDLSSSAIFAEGSGQDFTNPHQRIGTSQAKTVIRDDKRQQINPNGQPNSSEQADLRQLESLNLSAVEHPNLDSSVIEHKAPLDSSVIEHPDPQPANSSVIVHGDDAATSQPQQVTGSLLSNYISQLKEEVSVKSDLNTKLQALDERCYKEIEVIWSKYRQEMKYIAGGLGGLESPHPNNSTQKDISNSRGSHKIYKQKESYSQSHSQTSRGSKDLAEWTRLMGVKSVLGETDDVVGFIGEWGRSVSKSLGGESAGNDSLSASSKGMTEGAFNRRGKYYFLEEDCVKEGAYLNSQTISPHGSESSILNKVREFVEQGINTSPIKINLPSPPSFQPSIPSPMPPLPPSSVRRVQTEANKLWRQSVPKRNDFYAETDQDSMGNFENTQPSFIEYIPQLSEPNADRYHQYKSQIQYKHQKQRQQQTPLTNSRNTVISEIPKGQYNPVSQSAMKPVESMISYMATPSESISTPYESVTHNHTPNSTPYHPPSFFTPAGGSSTFISSTKKPNKKLMQFIQDPVVLYNIISHAQQVSVVVGQTDERQSHKVGRASEMRNIDQREDQRQETIRDLIRQQNQHSYDGVYERYPYAEMLAQKAVEASNQSIQLQKRSSNTYLSHPSLEKHSSSDNSQVTANVNNQFKQSKTSIGLKGRIQQVQTLEVSGWVGNADSSSKSISIQPDFIRDGPSQLEGSFKGRSTQTVTYTNRNTPTSGRQSKKVNVSSSLEKHKPINSDSTDLSALHAKIAGNSSVNRPSTAAKRAKAPIGEIQVHGQTSLAIGLGGHSGEMGSQGGISRGRYIGPKGK